MSDGKTTDAEINAALAKAMGVAPEVEYIVTRDGGKSCAANTGRGGHLTRESLEDWLRKKQAEGLMTEYEMGEWQHYPDYIVSPLDSAELEDWLHAKGIEVSSDCRQSHGKWEMLVQVIGGRPLVEGLELSPLPAGCSASATRRRSLALAALAAHFALCAPTGGPDAT